MRGRPWRPNVRAMVAPMELTEIGPFLSFLQSVRKRTRAIATVVPCEQLEWRPQPDAMSAGDLIRHIAGTERWMYVENVHGRPSRYPGHGVDLAAGRDAVLAYLDDLHQQSCQELAGISPEQLQTTCRTVAGSEVPVWLLLRVMLEHEIHHRGQLYSLVGNLGLPRPPLFGLSEREVRDASEAN